MSKRSIRDRIQRKIYKKTLKGRLSRKCSSINITARNRGYISNIKTHELLRLWKNQGGCVDICENIIADMKCNMCNDKIKTMEIGSFVADHIIPLSVGGCSTTKNIQFICNKCNEIKTREIDINASIELEQNNYPSAYKQMTFDF